MWDQIIGGISGGGFKTPSPKNFYADREKQWQINQYNYEQRVQADKESAKQYEFAQNGLQWKVRDAIAAGLSPLAGVGASGASYSPVSVGQMEPAPGIGQSLAQMGQSIGRAAAATLPSQQKEIQQLQIANLKLDLEGKAIENQYKSSQLRQLQQTGPGMPSPNRIAGQGNSGSVIDKPMERVVSAPGGGKDPGSANELGYMQSSKGVQYPLPSKDSKERMEDSLYETMHFIRNGILPNITGGNPPDDSYKWDPNQQGYIKRGKTKYNSRWGQPGYD